MKASLHEFLIRAPAHLEAAAAELRSFAPGLVEAQRLYAVFRLLHTLSTDARALGLQRLERLTAAAASLIERFQRGFAVHQQHLQTLLAALERMNTILADSRHAEQEPQGSDQDLIEALQLASTPAPDLEATACPDAFADGFAGVGPDWLWPADSREMLQQLFANLGQPGLPVTALPPEGNGQSAAQTNTARDAHVADSAELTSPPGQPAGNLQTLLAMISELVLARKQLIEILRGRQQTRLRTQLKRLSAVSAELQQAALELQTEPIGQAWRKLPALVRELCARSGKSIELELHGGEAELDRHLLPPLENIMIEAVRTLADQDIEMPADRRSADKRETATIRVCAHRQDGHMCVEIADDGRGLHCNAIGIGTLHNVCAGARDDLGNAASSSATGYGGNGLDLSEVKTSIARIRGTLELQPVPGKGTRLSITIPSPGLLSAFIVTVADETFAMPVAAAAELIKGDVATNAASVGAEYSPPSPPNDSLPRVDLREVLEISGGPADRTVDPVTIVAAPDGNRNFGVIVDRLLHREQILVNPLPTPLNRIRVFSGTAILADGSLVLVIDPDAIAERAGLVRIAPASATRDLPGTASPERMSVLVFRDGSVELKAVPLALVSRIEHCQKSDFEFADGRWFMPCDGARLPLVCLGGEISQAPSGSRSVLIISQDGRSVGLVVDEVVDIVQDKLEVKLTNDVAGTIGSVMIRGKSSDIVDVKSLLPLASVDASDRVPACERTVEVPGASLLLVEDAAFFRNLLIPVLNAAGFRVTAVNQGEQALELIKGEERFDVILSDIKLPGMTGLAFAEALRANPRAADIPLIGLCSSMTETGVADGRRRGFREFVTKFDRQGLLAALRSPKLRRTQAG